MPKSHGLAHIVVNAEQEEEAWVLVERLVKTTAMYKMTIGPDKTKVITNNPDGFQREIKIKGERLEAVKNVKYLDKSSLMKDQNPRFFSGLPRLQQYFLDWSSCGGTRSSRLFLRLSWCGISFYPPSFMSVRGGPWPQQLKQRIQALEMRCHRRLNISYKDHMTNEKVRSIIQNAIWVNDIS